MPDRASELLELAAHGVTAVLGTWLALTVLLRAGGRPGGRVFVFLSALLVTWSVAILVQRLTTAADVLRPANAIEEVASALLPAATLHIALALSVEGRRSRAQDAALMVAYGLAGFAAVLAVFFPQAMLAIAPPHFAIPGIPGAVFGWAWIGLRGLMFVLAVGWIAIALRAAGDDRGRRRQLAVTLSAVALGALGGMVRMTPPLSESEPWIGVSMVTGAVVLATYAVFAQGLFFGPEVASRAFRYAIAIGAGVTVYVAVLTAADQGVRETLGVELPIVIVLGLVGTMALFEPASDAIRRWISEAEGRDRRYDRLLRALGESVLTSQRPEGAIGPALARLSRTYRLTGAKAMDGEGGTLAIHGTVPDSALALHLPMRLESTTYGAVTFGPKRSQLPFTADEVELLGTAAAFLAASLRLSEREAEQAAELDVLSAERAEVATRGTALHQALVEPAAAEGLQVFALGPLRAQRGDELVSSWGGQKAGSRQAEALFAFLFDRGERGVSKDEAIELIWPDTDLDRADLAFHRTLGGLRRTLEPERRRGSGFSTIVFHNDRYRLDPSTIGWSDVAEFEERLGAVAAASSPEAQIGALQAARSLYRGDYLDDCPFYGDSAWVEERRELLRARYVDLLLALAERYEARDDRANAAAWYRQARQAAQDELPSADAALERLARVGVGQS